jgi:hypothetical protein
LTTPNNEFNDDKKMFEILGKTWFFISYHSHIISLFLDVII